MNVMNNINTLDLQYINLLNSIKNDGVWEKNRTGIDTKVIVGAMIKHDMSNGFPLLTCKRVPFKSMAVELEGFLKGITSKSWYKERGCNIWNEWCNPEKVKYGNDEITKEKMYNEDDLGRIYGAQWRSFKGTCDQVKMVIDTLSKDPYNRRAICSAWDPTELSKMALPPCHVLWQVMIINNKVNLTWYQRSVDTPLGLPFNIASYGLLLHLFAKHLKLEEGTLTGFLNNVHYYKNQEDGVDEIIRRGYEEVLAPLPNIATIGDDLFEWSHDKSKISKYNPLPTINIPIAV
jgi:thymidylate synthase